MVDQNDLGNLWRRSAEAALAHPRSESAYEIEEQCKSFWAQAESEGVARTPEDIWAARPIWPFKTGDRVVTITEAALYREMRLEKVATAAFRFLHDPAVNDPGAKARLHQSLIDAVDALQFGDCYDKDLELDKADRPISPNLSPATKSAIREVRMHRFHRDRSDARRGG